MAAFSVIVPVYNAAHTVERCVDSLVSSGGDDIQVILIEDSSKDNSLEVCRQLASKYENVLCFHNDAGKGVSSARNLGLKHASGDYLLFTDSDDWVAPDYIPAFRNAVAAGSGFAICGYINHDEKQNKRTDTIGWNDFRGMKRVSLRQELEPLFEATLLQQLWNKMFLNSVVQENDIHFDESISIGEDTRFVLDYIQKSGIREVTLINQPLYHYMRDQAGSLMFRVGYESVEEPLRNLRMLYALMGMAPDEIEAAVATDRRRQIELYAYLIFHNVGMSMKEKKRLILALDEQTGKALYRKNRSVYIKEQLAVFLKKARSLC